MRFRLDLFSALCPLLLLPILAVMLFVLTYFVYQKYQVRVRIKNVPYSTIFHTELDKVKKNLEIESMVYNFILVLLMIEMLANIFWGIDQFLTSKISSSKQNMLENRFLLLLKFLPLLTLSLIIPITCLFLIVLRRAFINLPYKEWVRRYSVYILARVTIMLVMSSFVETFAISELLLLPLTLFDICVYIPSSRAFYVLLKGRRDEALYHSSRSDYLEKRRIVNGFLYSQIFFYFGLLLMFLFPLFNFLYNLIAILYSTGFYSLFSFNSNNFPLPSFRLAKRIQEYFELILQAFTILLLVYVTVAYLIISVSILLKLFMKRRKFNHVNDWVTRLLMERYRSSLEKRRTQERPHFIQAIRSNLIYWSSYDTLLPLHITYCSRFVFLSACINMM